MRLIDEEYTRHPFYGTRKMGASLRRNGYTVNLQEGAAPDEDDGAGLFSTGEADNLAWGWSQDIPIPFKEFGYNLPEPGLVQ